MEGGCRKQGYLETGGSGSRVGSPFGRSTRNASVCSIEDAVCTSSLLLSGKRVCQLYWQASIGLPRVRTCRLVMQADERKSINGFSFCELAFSDVGCTLLPFLPFVCQAVSIRDTEISFSLQLVHFGFRVISS